MTIYNSTFYQYGSEISGNTFTNCLNPVRLRDLEAVKQELEKKKKQLEAVKAEEKESLRRADQVARFFEHFERDLQLALEKNKAGTLLSPASIVIRQLKIVNRLVSPTRFELVLEA